VSAFTAVLPARAADPQLLSLVMPDAKVLAGVNVDQAKTSPFGQYILNQMQPGDNHFKELTTLTGFDPTRDVHEVLLATSGGAGQNTGLVLARGNFDPARINALVVMKGAKSETYNGVTIVEDDKQANGFAFLNATVVAAGDVANAKAAIDRQTHATSLPASVTVQINQWSNTQHPWTISTGSPTSLHPSATMPPIPGLGPGGQNNNVFQNIQNAAGGVKFGANVVVTAQATAGSAQDATQLGDTLKLLASLAQLQANGDPRVLALVNSLSVSTNGSVLNVSVSLPQEQLVALVKAGPKTVAPQKKIERKF